MSDNELHQEFLTGFNYAGKKDENINLLSRALTYLNESIKAIISFGLKSSATCLIFNVVFTFQLKKLIEWAWSNVVYLELFMLELFVLVNVTGIRIIYSLTGTRVRKDGTPNGSYNSKGLLRTKKIHESFWNGQSLILCRDGDSYSRFATVSPITKFLDLSPRGKEASEVKEKTNVHNFELFTDEGPQETSSRNERSPQEAKIEPLLEFSNSKPQRHSYSPFHRRHKKNNDSQSIASNESKKLQGFPETDLTLDDKMDLDLRRIRKISNIFNINHPN